MTPTFLDKVFLTCLLCCAFLFAPEAVMAQNKVFHFNSPPAFLTKSARTFVYAIPQDLVYQVCFRGYSIDPSAPWMQQPAYIISYGKTDSLMSSAAVATGYYVAVRAFNNKMVLNIVHKPAFVVNIADLERIKILKVTDTNGVVLPTILVKKGKKKIGFDTAVNGFVVRRSSSNVITVCNKDDIQFFSYSIKGNDDYQSAKPRNEYYDYNRENRLYNGYLVTNKPRYRLNDTVKWKAYLLDPDRGNKPVEEALNVSFSRNYYWRGYQISSAFKGASPGVYFGEFILGDSVKTDQEYKLALNGIKTNFQLSQRFEVEDYLLNEINLKVTGEGRQLYQAGDSVNLYAYAFNSNNLPIPDGQITVTVFPVDIKRNPDGLVFIPDTLYHASMPVSTDGETNAGFSTNGFSPLLKRFVARVSLINSNYERKDTALYFDFTTDKKYLKVTQYGNQLHAAVISNKKPVKGKGSMRIALLHSKQAAIPITFPYDYVIHEQDAAVTFNLMDDEGNVINTCHHVVEEAALSADNDFVNDTAVLSLHNPSQLIYMYSIYKGRKFAGYGVAERDTVIKIYSKKGRTVTVIGSYVWQGASHSKRFGIFKKDKELNIDLKKKDMIYPGQKDTIRIALTDKKGKGIEHTNVTVLAFNNQFKDDNTPEIPYGGKLRPAYSSSRIHSIEPMSIHNLWDPPITKEWLSKCGADTQFFYKNLYLLKDNVAWVTYDIPKSVQPQAGIYLFRDNHYYQPEIIYIDGNPVYIKHANSTDPSGFFVEEGLHRIRFRMAKEEYSIDNFYVAAGMKTDMYLNIDTSCSLYKNDSGMKPAAAQGAYPLYSFVERRKKHDSLDYSERNMLAGSLLLYRNEDLKDYHDRPWGSPYFQQYPYEFGRRGLTVNYDRYYSQQLQLIGPFRFNNSVNFYQRYNTKLSFMPEPNEIFSFRSQMTRVERHQIDYYLRYRLNDEEIWPVSNYVAENPINTDSLEVMPWDLSNVQLFNNGVVTKDGERYSVAANKVLPVAEKSTAGIRMMPVEDSLIRYVIYYRLDGHDSTPVLSRVGNAAIRLAPGTYKALIIWNNNHYSVYESVKLKVNGLTVVPLSYEGQKGLYNFMSAPSWLSEITEPASTPALNYYTVDEVKISYGGYSGIQGTLTDEKGNPLPSAQITVTQGGISRGGIVTNFDGEYIIKHLEAGRYDVTFKWQNFQQTITNVIVNTDAVSTVNNKLNTTQVLTGRGAIVVMASRVNVPPLVDARKPGGRLSRTAEQIEKMPTANYSGVASLSAQSYQSKNGAGLSLGGVRNYGSQYVIDGAIVSGGHTNPVMGSIDQVTTYMSGTPARYGDASGGAMDVADYGRGGYNTRTGKRGFYLSSDASAGFISDFMANMMGASGLRKDFRDWAIWEPDLWTDDDGRTSFKVTYPDKMTSWKTYVLAMNRHGFAGRILKLTRSFKPLSAQLSAPRFLRYGDTAEVIGKVANYTQQPFSLQQLFSCGDSLRSSDTMTVHNTKVSSFTAIAPALNRYDTTALDLSYSITAESGYKDGEIYTLPVQPVGVVESKGQFTYMISDTTVLSVPDTAAGHFTGKTKIFIDGSMLEAMLREIEELKVYPHGCNEQLTTKLLSVYYEEMIKKMMGEVNFNNTIVKKKLLNQLIKSQRNDGGFGWWSNNATDYRITNYVLSTLQKINEDGWLNPVITPGLMFLDNHIPDMAATDKIAALTTLSAAAYPSSYKPVLDKIDVRNASIYDRMAMVKIRKEQSLPYRDELDTLMKMRDESVHGISWGHFTYDWYRDDLAATLLAYAIVKDDSIYKEYIPAITRGLMFHRKGGYYKNTASSGLVLATLIPELLKQRSLDNRKHTTYVKVSGTLKDSITVFPRVYELKNSKPAFTFEKKGINPVFVSVVYSYLNIKPARRDADFEVQTYFMNARHDTVTTLKAGEKMMVRTTVTCKKDAEYVMIEVPVPAGCVQDNKKNDYNAYPEASREHFKDQTYIFCDKLVKGTYSFDVVLEARYKGAYNLSPARAGMMYYPEEYGHTEVKKVRIK